MSLPLTKGEIEGVKSLDKAASLVYDITMATITLDTYNFIERLTSVGIEEKQAKAIAAGLKDLSLENVATKEDILKLEARIESIKADIFKWLVPLLVGQIAAFAAVVKFMS